MYKPQFSITNNILSYISKIEVAKEYINNSHLVPSWTRKFQEEALVRQVHHSTAIEENSLEKDEVRQLLKGNMLIQVKKRDIKEIINYRRAIEFIDNQKGKLSLDLILQINKIVLSDIINDNKIGILRNSNVMLMNSRSHELVMEPPAHDEVADLIEDLIEWYNFDNDIHPVLKAGILQYEITAIHPFIEGNGRTARLLSTWSLYTNGYEVNRYFCLEEYYDQDLKGYYNALGETDETNDHTYWLEYFSKGLAYEFTRIMNKVKSISLDSVLRKRGGQIALSERQVKLMNFILENGQFQNKDFSIVFPKISDDTILREIKDLMDKGIIKKVGRTKGARYIMK